MKLHEAISEVIESNYFNQTIRRRNWAHGDSLMITNSEGYMRGELFWKISGNKASLFFVDDILSDDWIVE